MNVGDRVRIRKGKSLWIAKRGGWQIKSLHSWGAIIETRNDQKHPMLISVNVDLDEIELEEQ